VSGSGSPSHLPHGPHRLEAVTNRETPGAAFSPPLVYVGDDSKDVKSGLIDPLTAVGMEVHTPSSQGDPDDSTRAVSFACAVMHLDRMDGTADAIDAAELLRMYQPDLRVAFLYANASHVLVQRARALGPIYHCPSELDGALLWVRETVKA
jgi:hypothetical protein